MPRQPELLPRDELKLSPPKGRKEPRLWVRRLVIWRDQAQAPIRDISLRPGLNIVWSPDGGDQGSEALTDVIGHGGGKTLFCRLVRYCLGEPRYATERQRQRIAEEMPDGAVGAEIILQGQLWSVIRPFVARKRHIAVSGKALDDALGAANADSSYDAFPHAAAKSFFPSAVLPLVPKGKQLTEFWLMVLAWLTRDQECRFHHALDWRAADSESESPARGLPRAEQLDVLRICLTALDPEEHALRGEIAREDANRQRLEGDRNYLTRACEDERLRLVAALKVADTAAIPGQMGIAPLAAAAKARLAAATSAKTQAGRDDITNVRRLLEEAQKELGFILQRKSAIDAKIPVVKQLIARINAEMPGLSFSEADAEAPACPICDVPISRVLAERCKLSDRLPDLQSIRERRQKRREELLAEEKNLSSLEAEVKDFPSQIALADQVVKRHAAHLQRLEVTREEQQATWYEAQRLNDDVVRYGRMIERSDTAASDFRKSEEKIKQAAGRVAAFRDKQSSVIARFSLKFDILVREILGSQAKGSAILLADGLALTIQYGGDRSTAAIESLKIIALDLAALMLSIEGGALSPEFLIHDSPREADLGMSLYSRIFALSRKLEGATDTPLFQYIITTTTQPPAEFKQEPWLRLTLHGSPAEERLLRCDL